MLKVTEVYDAFAEVDVEACVQELKDKGYVHYTWDMILEDLQATYTSSYLIETIMEDAIIPYVLEGYKILYKPERGAVPALYKLPE